MKRERSERKKRSITGKRVLIIALVGVFLMVGGVLGYSWLLKAQADRVYQLGKSVNEFFRTYSSAIKSHDVDSILDLYHEDYANPSEGSWGEKPVDTGDYYLAGVSANISDWTIENPREFRKSDLRDQFEDFNKKISSVEMAKFKVEAIEDSGRHQATVRVIWWLRGKTPKGQGDLIESRVTFRFWLKKEGDNWRIRRKDLIGGTIVRGAGVGFVDVAEESGIDFKAVHNPMLRDDPMWQPEQFEIMQYAHGGVATSDYDGDGDDDIFFGDGESPRLYRNEGNWRFKDVTVSAFQGKLGENGRLPGTSVALFVDFDNDGDEDLFLGRSTGPNKLFCNNGDETFSEVCEDSPNERLARNAGVSRDGAREEGEWCAIASAADYNNDGLVDLYVGRYLDPRHKLPTTLFYTRNSEGNTLLRNNGNLTFTDVTEEMGVREGGLTLGSAWGDYDKDGDVDLYVANDFGRNAFFENQGATGKADSEGRPLWNRFKEISQQNGTFDVSYGMSATFADIDNDADLDLYVSNVHSGQRWFGNKATLKNYIATTLRQRQYFEDAKIYNELTRLAEDKWALGDRVIRGNSLFRNDGRGKGYTDVTEDGQVNPHGWYWGSLISDFDNDGRQDIYAANGWISGKEPDDL
jgi:ketosteroid isomerase-like protein